MQEMKTNNNYSSSTSQTLQILNKLISFPSTTPLGKDCLQYIGDEILRPLGFKVEIVPVRDAFFMYAKIGNQGTNFCFSGHVDVVSPGDLSQWDNSPFEMHTKNGNVYGRGVCDMKGGIACFLSATIDHVDQYIKSGNSLSFLITTDEERPGITVMKDAVEYLQNKNEQIDMCLIGEPTGIEKACDALKIGRRGSITFEIAISGKQGHVANEGSFDNPNTVLMQILNELKFQNLDKGNDYFPPSNLEIVQICSGSGSFNVVPAKATATVNIRFNNEQTFEKLEQRVNKICNKFSKDFTINTKKGNINYISVNKILMSKIVKILKAENKIVNINCNGGTSDGCYLSLHCTDIVEIGLNDQTSHQVNEHSSIADIDNLTQLFKSLLKSF